MATIQIHDDKQNKIVTLDKIEKSDKEWKKILSKKEYEITTNRGTESPGAYFGEIGHLFGLKTAGCPGKSATPI